MYTKRFSKLMLPPVCFLEKIEKLILVPNSHHVVLTT